MRFLNLQRFSIISQNVIIVDIIITVAKPQPCREIKLEHCPLQYVNKSYKI